MPLFALGNEPSTGILCFDHFGRNSGGSSLIQKILFLACYPFITFTTWYLTFADGASTVLALIGMEPSAPVDGLRAKILVSYSAVISIRYMYNFGMSHLATKLTYGYDTIMLVVSFQMTLHGGTAVLARLLPAPPHSVMVISIVCFAIGFLIEYLHDSQLQAFVQLKEAGHAGGKRVLTTGTRAFSRHANHFGNTVYWSLGVCLIPGSVFWSAMMGFTFIFFYHLQAMPGLEAHMARKYGSEWTDYAGKTPIFFPFVKCAACEPKPLSMV